MNQTLPAAPNSEPSKSQSGRRTRHGLIEDWRDAVGILLLLLVAAFFGALISRMLPGTEDGMAGNDADLAVRISALEAKTSKTSSASTADVRAEIIILETRLETRLDAVERDISLFGTNSAEASNTHPGKTLSLKQQNG